MDTCASEFGKEVELLLVVDTFGDYIEAETPGKPDDGRRNSDPVAVGESVLDERAIDLQRIGWELVR